MGGVLGGFFVDPAVWRSFTYSAFSGSGSAGFMVLTRRVKYSKWQTHTTAVQGERLRHEIKTEKFNVSSD